VFPKSFGTLFVRESRLTGEHALNRKLKGISLSKKQAAQYSNLEALSISFRPLQNALGALLVNLVSAVLWGLRYDISADSIVAATISNVIAILLIEIGRRGRRVVILKVTSVWCNYPGPNSLGIIFM
jgi:hypothetical protein